MLRLRLPRLTAQHPAGLTAASLSFVWPGLGQLYLGRRRGAALYAIPLLIIAAALVVQVADGLTVFAARLLDPSFSLTLLILILLLGGWRLVAMFDALLPRTERRPISRRTTVVLAILVVAVVATHGLAAFFTYSFYRAGSSIFVGDDPDGGPPVVQASAAPTDDYEVPPFATPPSESARINILLTGVDKSTERTHSLTDTMMVVSFDPVSRTAAMINFPRDIARFPLYSGGTYDGKINSLMSYVARNPGQFPDGPLPTLANELAYLLGIQIHYFAAVDLDGFRKMIDAVGGVTVNVDRAIADPAYDWLDGSPRGFYLAAGRQRLDSRTALAYVRSRQGAGDNDFTRAARQQQLLLALQAKMSDPANFGKLPAVLEAAAATIRTSFPADRVGEMMELARDFDAGAVRRVVLQPPTYSHHPPTSSTGGTYILQLNWDAIRTLSVEVFGTDSAFWTGQFDPSGSPIPKPAP